MHVWVGQKLLKRNFKEFYSLSQSCNQEPILPKMIINVNLSLKWLNAISTPPTKYPTVSPKFFPSVWYAIPLLLLGAILLLHAHFQRVDNEKQHINWHRYDLSLLLEQIPSQWRRPVASSETLDLLHRTMCVVTYRRIAMAIGMASKVDVFFHHFSFAVALAATRAIRSK